MNQELTLNLLLERDADEIINAVSRLPPSELNKVYLQAVGLITSTESKPLNLSRALLIAQTILSNDGAAPCARDCLTHFHKLVRFASGTQDRRLRQQAMVVASLVAQRLGTSFASLADSVNAELNSLSTDSSVSSIVFMLKQKLDRVLQRAQGRRQYSLPTLDIKKAQANVIEDAKQDWFRDPWEWPELTRATTGDVGECLDNGDCGWTFALDIPKSSDGVRPAIIMAPLDRIAFQCLADELSLVATNDLPNWVFGWRVSRSAPAKGVYEDNSREWKTFKQHIKTLSSQYAYVLRVDIQGFFQSVDTAKLLSDLGRNYKRTGTLARLEDYLKDLQSRRNGAGLPQRSLASSVLAHVPLSAVDRFLSVIANETGPDKVSPLRWMDDIWLFGNSESRLRSISAEIEVALDYQGLGLNPRKTVFEECDSAIENLILDSSGNTGVDDVDSSEAFSKRLLELAESIGEAPRSDISFLLKYKGENRQEVNDVVLARLRVIALDQLDHAADRIADFLRTRDGWREHLHWYEQLVRRQVDTHSWPIAAWGNMFPVGYDRSLDADAIRAFLKERFVNGMQHSLVPLAAHRTAAWNSKGTVRDVLFEYLATGDAKDDYFVVRAIALAAQQAGLSKSDVIQEIAKKYREFAEKVSELL